MHSVGLCSAIYSDVALLLQLFPTNYKAMFMFINFNLLN